MNHSLTTPSKSARKSLTSMERLFVDAYDGNTLLSMKLAGFNGTDQSLRRRGEQLLEDPDIAEAIRDRGRYQAKSLAIIADREERMALWSSVMRNQDPHYKPEVDGNNIPIPETNIPLQTRLKASEMLGKAEGDFIERIDITQTLSISDLVLQSYDDKTPIEELEAAYYAARKVTNNQKAIVEAEFETENLEDLI